MPTADVRGVMLVGFGEPFEAPRSVILICRESN